MAMASILNNNTKSVLITGGTGFIGQALVPQLITSGYKVVLLSRNPQKYRSFDWPVRWIQNFSDLSNDTSIDTVINFAGESLSNGRWTSAKKQRLFQSRVAFTEALYHWLSQSECKPKLLLNASAVGYYGPHGAEILDEESPPNDSFGHRLCAEWEHQAQRIASLGTRVLCLRLGVVLDQGGGAFREMAKSLPFKVATQMGNGRHYFPWVHRLDVVRIVLFLLSNSQADKLSGPVNCVAPDPITYAQLANQLKIHSKSILTLSAPALLLKWVLGQMAEELLLSGQNVTPKKLLEAGFTFHFDQIEAAIKNCLETAKSKN